MTKEEIRNELKARGWTLKTFAEKLKISYVSVAHIMNGRNKITDQLGEHIKLLFAAEQNAVLVYKVNLSDKQVLDLTSGKQFADTPEGHAARARALEAVVQHNIAQLAEYGKACNWTPAERKWLGLDDNPEGEEKV